MKRTPSSLVRLDEGSENVARAFRRHFPHRSSIGCELPLRLEKVLPVRVADVDGDARLAEGALCGSPIGDVVPHEVTVFGDAEDCRVDIAAVDQRRGGYHFAAGGLHGSGRLSNREARVDDVVDDQHAALSHEPIVPAMKSKLAAKLLRGARLRVLGEDGGQTKVEGRPLRDDQSTRCRAAQDFGTEVAYRSGEQLGKSPDALQVDKDCILIDPAAAMIAGDVNEVIVREQGPTVDEHLLRFDGGVGRV